MNADPQPGGGMQEKRDGTGSRTGRQYLLLRLEILHDAGIFKLFGMYKQFYFHIDDGFL